MDRTNPIPESDLDTKPTFTTGIVSKSSKKLFLPKQTLQGYGCKNCIWKSYGQCPKGFTQPSEEVDEGFCKELVEFIFNLAEPEDGISAVKEKFFLYTQEMQAMADNSEFNKKLQEWKEFKATDHPDMTEKERRQKLGELEMTMTSFKIWWSRLTDSVVKGLSRIADRERRSKDVKGTKKITVQQLNVLLKESDKKIKELK